MTITKYLYYFFMEYNLICSFSRPEEQYVLIGYSNGILRLHRLYDDDDTVVFDGPFLNWSLNNYWLITLHDANYGAIRD